MLICLLICYLFIQDAKGAGSLYVPRIMAPSQRIELCPTKSIHDPSSPYCEPLISVWDSGTVSIIKYGLKAYLLYQAICYIHFPLCKGTDLGGLGAQSVMVNWNDVLALTARPVPTLQCLV